MRIMVRRHNNRAITRIWLLHNQMENKILDILRGVEIKADKGDILC